MSYGRMRERRAQLESEVAELLRKAEEVDEEEDRRYGRDSGGMSCRRSWPSGRAA